jgi:hypothetical protein
MFVLAFYLIRDNKKGLFWVVFFGTLAKETALIIVAIYFINNLDLKSLNIKSLFNSFIKSIPYALSWLFAFIGVRVVRELLFGGVFGNEMFFPAKTRDAFTPVNRLVYNTTTFSAQVFLILHLFFILYLIKILPAKQKFLKKMMLFFTPIFYIVYFWGAPTHELRHYLAFTPVAVPILLFKFRQLIKDKL